MSAKNVTLTDVAARAGVSLMTASYTFNRPARVSARSRAAVTAAAAALGFVGPDPSARSLRRRRTNCLGVVLGEHLSYAFDDPQAAGFLAGIAEVCAERGYAMTILPITGRADDATRVRVAAVDGFVVWTTVDRDPVVAALQALGSPTVVHSGPAGEGLGLVTINNRAAARAIGTVTFAGARRPAILSFPFGRDRIPTISHGARPAASSFAVTRSRLQGFRDAARRTGQPWESITVAACARNDRNEAESMTAELLRGGRPPDAIAAMSDEQAVGAIRAIRAAGLEVPVDVAVSGWDDSALAAELELTTVAQSLRQQGVTCARAVLDNDLRRHIAPWSLLLRASTRS